ncbi:ABC-2 type transporter [uncultured archaeon]|nr:ABC-2 type transporter [uncultured archaeon]
MKIYAVWLREIKRFINSKSRMVGSLAMPLLFLVALGGGFSSFLPAGSVPGGVSYSTYLLPGIVAMTILFTSIFSGVSIIWDREFGFLKEMLAAPTGRENIVFGRTLGGATTAIIQGLMILIIGLVITCAPIPSPLHIAGAFVFMFFLSCFLVAVGIALASMIQEVETFQLIMNLIVMPLFFLSNALIPVEKMPDIMKGVTTLNPITYAVDGLRDLMIGQGTFGLPVDFAVCFIGFIVALTVATYLFSKTAI